jgi:isopentenyl diphosphate isomerase/L-lactate dehydrogenase-like FMN-dependent dehydrogenase
MNGRYGRHSGHWSSLARNASVANDPYETSQIGFSESVPGLTVDSPTYNNREFDIRNGANFPPRVTLRSAIDGLSHPRWLFGTLARYVLAEGRLPRFPNVHFPPAAAGGEELHGLSGGRLPQPQ